MEKRFTDEAGSSQILRSGRFGIGVLAAFLIGDRVKVSTRHYDQNEGQGVEFEFGLEDSTIEMKWLSKKIGTTVKVRTTESTISRLMKVGWDREEWDWYCLDKPVVIRRDVSGNTMKQKYVLPSIAAKLPIGFHKINVQGLQEVHWTYAEKAPALVCNGILIPNGKMPLRKYFMEQKEGYTHLILGDPKISVYDPDGRLPLNLARNSLASSYHPLNTELVSDLCKNFIAYSLLKGPRERLLSDDMFDIYTKPNYPGMNFYYYSWFGTYFDTAKGFGLTDPWNVSHFSSLKGLLICKELHGNLPKDIAASAMSDYSLVFGNKLDGTLGAFDYWHRILALTPKGSEQLPPYMGMKVSGLRTLMSKASHDRFLLKQPKFITRSTEIEMKSVERVIWTIGKCDDTAKSLTTIADHIDNNFQSLYSLTEIYFSPTDEISPQSRIAQYWEDVIGAPIIPFGQDERKAIISKLDDSWQRHIDQWSIERSRRTK